MTIHYFDSHEEDDDDDDDNDDNDEDDDLQGIFLRIIDFSKSLRKISRRDLLFKIHHMTGWFES